MIHFIYISLIIALLAGLWIYLTMRYAVVYAKLIEILIKKGFEIEELKIQIRKYERTEQGEERGN